MQRVDNVAALTAEIERIRQQAGRLTTNWFVTPGRVQRWIDRGVLFQAAATDAVLIFRRDRDFFHIYHVVGIHDTISRALASSSLTNLPLTTDIVGLPNEVRLVAATYRQNGFHERRTLIRMVRLSSHEINDLTGKDCEVVFAGPADVPAVNAFFDQVLDPLADQIPDLDEFRELATQRKILMVKRGETIGGVLLFEITGITTLLRYWYVDPAQRDQGIGARLIRTFLHLNRAAKRILLWVVSDNQDAIAKYQHYGFARERLVDCVLSKEITRATKGDGS